MVMKAKSNKSNKKLTIAALGALALFASAGSAFGTMAWYQYSTIAYGSVVVTDATVTENLQIAYGEQDKDYNGFKSSLSISDIENGLKADNKNSEVKPVTNGGSTSDTKNAALDKLYSNPTYQYFELANWAEADENEYISFPLTLKLNKVAKEHDESTFEKDVYLEDLVIKKANNSTMDFSSAIRVHFSCTDYENKTTNMLFSKDGHEIETSSKLDLNGDGVDDYAKNVYDFDDADSKKALVYGTEGSIQKTYKLDDVKPTDDNTGKLTGGMSLGKIKSDDVLVVNVTIWLEGWEKLNAKSESAETMTTSSIWSTDYIGSAFNVGMTFAVSTL